MSGGIFIGVGPRDRRVCAFEDFETDGDRFTCKVNADEAVDLPQRVKAANIPNGILGVRVTAVGDRDRLGDRRVSGVIVRGDAP